MLAFTGPYLNWLSCLLPFAFSFRVPLLELVWVSLLALVLAPRLLPIPVPIVDGLVTRMLPEVY